VSAGLENDYNGRLFRFWGGLGVGVVWKRTMTDIVMDLLLGYF
jgi:hypothetical protein